MDRDSIPYVPVNEHHGLVRDARSNSIINTDHVAYQNAMTAKRARRQLNNDVSALKAKVHDLEVRLCQLEQIIKSNNK